MAREQHNRALEKALATRNPTGVAPLPAKIRIQQIPSAKSRRPRNKPFQIETA